MCRHSIPFLRDMKNRFFDTRCYSFSAPSRLVGDGRQLGVISTLLALNRTIDNEGKLHIACRCLYGPNGKIANPRICGRITSCRIAPQATHPPYTQHVKGGFLLPILVDVTIECGFYGLSSSLQRALNGAVSTFIGQCCDVHSYEKLRDALKLLHVDFDH